MVISTQVRERIALSLSRGDQALIVKRLKQKGVKISPCTLSCFLNGKRPMKTIGLHVVEEAASIVEESRKANANALAAFAA